MRGTLECINFFYAKLPKTGGKILTRSIMVRYLIEAEKNSESRLVMHKKKCKM
jgi:hypothetical protein